MIEYSPSKSFVEAFNVLPMLNGLTSLYPDFEYWYVNTMIPGLITGNDVLLLAKEHGQTVGVALGKLTDTETKLRCVRVIPEYQNKGTGLHLIERMLKLLDNDKPHCTVAEEIISILCYAESIKAHIAQVNWNTFLTDRTNNYDVLIRSRWHCHSASWCFCWHKA
jgi:GNAT superfamily N-acetyltransferase